MIRRAPDKMKKKQTSFGVSIARIAIWLGAMSLFFCLVGIYFVEFCHLPRVRGNPNDTYDGLHKDDEYFLEIKKRFWYGREPVFVDKRMPEILHYPMHCN